MKQNNRTRTRILAATGLFAALAYVVMLIFHLPVSFLTLDIKDAVITLAGLYFGPLSALFGAIAVPLFEMVTVSHTELWGLLMNILGTVAFSLTVSVIYKVKKNFFGAILGLISGTVCMTAVMLALNLVVTPIYMHVSVEAVKEMILPLLLPFNLIKSVLNASVVLLLYKPLSSILHRVGFLPESSHALRMDFRTVTVTVVSVLLIEASIATVLILF